MAERRIHFSIAALLVTVISIGSHGAGARVSTVHEAARSGDVAQLKELLERDPGLANWVDATWGTPLAIAAVRGRKEVVELLLTEGADPNLVGGLVTGGLSPLFWAAYSGHQDIARVLREHGARLDMFSACALGDVGEVSALLDADARLANARSKGGETSPLHVAAHVGHEQVVELLLARGANIKAKDDRGNTPLHEAAAKGHASVVRELLAHGADVWAKNDGDRTPLFVACERAGNVEVVEMLIRAVGDLRENRDEGRSALWAASRRGHAGVVVLLLAKGAPIGERTGYYSLLFDAAFEAHLDVVRLLIAAGADVEARDEDGNTSLHYAVRGGDHVEIVNLLLKRTRRTMGLKNVDGLTPLALAARYGRKKASDALVKAGNPIDDPVTALLLCRDEEVRSFCGSPPFADWRDYEGMTLLHWAAKVGNSIAVGLLLHNGADVNARAWDTFTAGHWRVNTPLDFALEEGHADVARLLLEKGADVNPNGPYSRHPLRTAAIGGREQIVALPLDYGANVNATARDGRTPLHVAAFYGHVPVVVLLLDRGADPSAKTREGETALDLARDQNHAEVVALLKAKGAEQ